MADIHPALRAHLDGELNTAIAAMLHQAAQYDGRDIIEANVDLTGDLLALLSPAQLAAAAAGLALRLHRSKAGADRG